jgi:phage terminase large subunit-like protein
MDLEDARRGEPAHQCLSTFPQLEDEMTNFTSDIDRAAAGYSPDRVDALVWEFSECWSSR